MEFKNILILLLFQMERKEVKSAKSGMGVAVSTLHNADDPLADEQKTIFDWLKEGNILKVTQLLNKTKEDLNEVDDSGMALIHWACDRGYTELVQILLDHRADINVRDSDGQTPLHYAVSCEHAAIVKLLILRGADMSLVDSSGTTVQNSSDNPEIMALIVAAQSS